MKQGGQVERTVEGAEDEYNSRRSGSMFFAVTIDCSLFCLNPVSTMTASGVIPVQWIGVRGI